LEGIRRRIPYHHGGGPFSLTGDLYDRFAAPIEQRYDRTTIEGWLRGAGLKDIAVRPMRGWVAFGRKAGSETMSAVEEVNLNTHHEKAIR
jgi:hypothetical protein